MSEDDNYVSTILEDKMSEDDNYVSQVPSYTHPIHHIWTVTEDSKFMYLLMFI